MNVKKKRRNKKYRKKSEFYIFLKCELKSLRNLIDEEDIGDMKIIKDFLPKPQDIVLKKFP